MGIETGVVGLVQKYQARHAYLDVTGQDTSQPGLQVPVTVINVRQVYGNDQLLVTPHRGHGTMWVHVSRVHVVEEWIEESDNGDAEASELEQGEPVGIDEDMSGA